MAIQSLFPNIKPTLNLNFAGTKTLDPRITFSRPSPQTYFDAKGVMRTAPANVPVFDHDPITGESLGYVGYEQRTNLLLWSAYGGASGETAPTGWIINFNTGVTTTAPSVRFSGGIVATQTGTMQREHYVQNLTLVAGTTYTLSAYFHTGTSATEIILAVVGLTAGFSGSDRVLGSSFTVAGRYSITFTPVANDLVGIRIGLGCLGSATGTVIHELPQLEAGAFPTPYIKTEASQVTRAASSAVMTGDNFSSWYRPDQGTFVVDWAKVAPSAFQAVIGASGGTSSNVIVIGHGSISGSNNNLRLDITAGGVSQASITTITNSLSSTFYRTSGAYKVNDFAVVTNGNSAVTDTSGILPVVNRLNIGTNSAGNGGFLNGYIRSIQYYPQRLTDAQLQALSRI
jgi:hypothetical protein